ncbi:MAG: hypothetical protein ABI981_07310 [Betaproteobacteria bacterium]
MASVVRGLIMLALAMPATCFAEEAKWAGAVTGYYYAMRDEPDFGVGVGTLDYGRLHLEGRWNYEARDAGSAFVGWKFAGGDAVTFAITPIVGALFGTARGVIPGVEASIASGPFDAYVEAEYVDDRRQPGSRYYYSWTELAWTPVEWLRVGLAGQRTHTVDTGRGYQRGGFAQVTVQRLKFSLYAFNPESSARYVIGAITASF